MKILIQKLHPDAHLPAYAHGPLEDAGLDLRAVERVVLEPGVAQAVPTGIAIELPPGHERYEAIEWEEAALGDSSRGTGGFGSSGR